MFPLSDILPYSCCAVKVFDLSIVFVIGSCWVSVFPPFFVAGFRCTQSVMWPYASRRSTEPMGGEVQL